MVYLPCTDYADTHELITALIEKTNNCLFRWLVRLSISRILAILGKFELKQFIGINKVIVFDEFERLVDYNKIDPMHIVSLIQYLNNQKNCICILVANDEPLNNNSQFTNVREKLISYIYNYMLPFEDAIKIIKDRNNGSNFIDLESVSFSEIRKDLYNSYQIDNNIRMIEHAYIKTNQIYSLNKNFTDFKRNDKSIHITEEEFFALLFSNVLVLINPLYYLYLKNPYNLKAIETLAIVVYMSKKLEHPAADEQNDKLILKNCLDKNSIPSLALDCLNKNIISYKNGNHELYDVSYNLNYIITNQIFENIDATLITEFLVNEKIVIQFILKNREYGETFNQNIKFFMRLFKETFCENDNPELIEDYFKSINVLGQKFSRMMDDDKNSSWDDSIVTDYIAYCQYIDKAWPRGDPNNIRQASYDRIAYINALIIQTINNNSINNVELIVKQIIDYNKADYLSSLIYELTCIQAVKKNKINELIKLIQQIKENLSEKYNPTTLLDFMHHSYDELQRAAVPKEYSSDGTTWNEFVNLVNQMANDLIAKQEKTLKVLDFMYNSYNTFKCELLKNNTNSAPQVKESIENTVILCNKNLISLLTFNRNTQEFINKLFMLLDNFNDGSQMEIFKTNSLPILVDIIKEIYNSHELLQKFITILKDGKWETSKQVVNVLEKELNTPDAQNKQETERKE